MNLESIQHFTLYFKARQYFIMFVETMPLDLSSQNWRQIQRPYTGSAYTKNYKKKWLKISIPAFQLYMCEITEMKAHLFVFCIF
jgi:hypothetical protein